MGYLSVRKIYRIYTQNIDEDNNSVELTSLKINFIPIGFELVGIHEGRNILIYNYSADSSQEFDIKLFASSGDVLK